MSPKGVWIIAGTPVSEPYPCRCHEARYGKCNPAFCPCAGRDDPQNSECCAHRYRPEDVSRAAREWEARRRVS